MIVFFTISYFSLISVSFIDALNCSRAVTAFPPERDGKCCGGVSGNKIYRGEVTEIDDYPWLVVIEYDLGHRKLLCGGSLISSKYVLTAAHCVTGNVFDYSTLENVRLGEYNITHNGPDCVELEAGGIDCTLPVIIAPIEKIIPHPEYNPRDKQRKHDIALIRLKTTAPYTDFVRPICLPSKDYTQQPSADLQFSVAGWGQYKPFQNSTVPKSELKQHAVVPYIGREECQAALRTLHGSENLVINNRQLCARKDSSKGDSGGPLMYQVGSTFEVVGVLSYGMRAFGRSNVPNVYTNVYEYIPWITSTIEA